MAVIAESVDQRSNDQRSNEVLTNPSIHEQDVLQHLLAVEANALALVNDAQAVADRRVTDGEKQNRARYEERYTREAAALDAQYGEELQAIKEEYNKQLDAFRQELDGLKPDRAQFDRLLDNFLRRER
ncbi:MAG: hypothetical protein LBT16_10400 [Treponema sp.]|jgi:hypothetical protein|nr:hypothetical protein [Treponema sp.]